MCVIIVSEKEKPTLELLQKCEVANPDGGGFAWRHNNKVRYHKGLTAGEIFKEQKSLPLPLVTHFRLATHGGKSPLLCHPFPVSRNAELSLEGLANKLLFHNGIWHDWKKLCIQTLMRKNIAFPSGIISDSRAMAWFCYCWGTSMLSLISEKVVVFTAKNIEVYGDGWEQYEKHLVSNTFFLHTSYLCAHWCGDTKKSRK